MSDANQNARDVSIDYLRASIIVLVVLHHAALAYTSFSVFIKTSYVSSTAPVVDSARWLVLDFFVGFNDAFFMSLLFFVSGLFVMASLKKSGSLRFFISRLKRLGIPFVVGSIILIPLCYWPSHKLADASTLFWISFYTTDGWPSGPLWFLWVLLVYSGIIALIYRFLPGLLDKLSHAPSVLIMLMITLIAYVPIGFFVDPYTWGSLGGPFDVQLSRVALYFIYFFIGVVIGFSRIISIESWPRKWFIYFVVGLCAYYAHGQLLGSSANFSSEALYKLCLSLAFSVSCVAIGFSVFAVFRKYINKPHPLLNSLSQNAFGIYLLHYIFVVWSQYFLLDINIAVWLKFVIVSFISLLLSWLASIGLRKIPYVAHII